MAEFFAGCIIAGLEFIHSNSILHRDIKPENLVFEESGYLRITDFGIARKWSPDNSKETSGTPGYMAPEVMCRQNHGMEVDYFALGVILYECMLGRVDFHQSETLYRQIEKRNKRSNTRQANSNQERGDTEGVERRSSRVYQCPYTKEAV